MMQNITVTSRRRRRRGASGVWPAPSCEATAKQRPWKQWTCFFFSLSGPDVNQRDEGRGSFPQEHRSVCKVRRLGESCHVCPWPEDIAGPALPPNVLTDGRWHVLSGGVTLRKKEKKGPTRVGWRPQKNTQNPEHEWNEVDEKEEEEECFKMRIRLEF